MISKYTTDKQEYQTSLVVLSVGNPAANAEDVGVNASFGMSHMLQDN